MNYVVKQRICSKWFNRFFDDALEAKEFRNKIISLGGFALLLKNTI